MLKQHTQLCSTEKILFPQHQCWKTSSNKTRAQEDWSKDEKNKGTLNNRLFCELVAYLHGNCFSARFKSFNLAQNSRSSKRDFKQWSPS